MKNWFANINWLKLKLQFNMFIIQTNRCFIKNTIRDLLCIRRFFIKIFNDYRISLINDLFVIFTIFEIKSCEIFLITSFDAYIEICSLKFEQEFEHQCRIIVFSFLIWIVILFSFNEIDVSWNLYVWRSQIDNRFWKSSFSNIIRLMTFSRNLFSKIVSKMTMKKKIKKKKTWKYFI